MNRICNFLCFQDHMPSQVSLKDEIEVSECRNTLVISYHLTFLKLLTRKLCGKNSSAKENEGQWGGISSHQAQQGVHKQFSRIGERWSVQRQKKTTLERGTPRKIMLEFKKAEDTDRCSYRTKHETLIEIEVFCD